MFSRHPSAAEAPASPPAERPPTGVCAGPRVC